MLSPFLTATPIPRTLSLYLYGDLEVSTINELPAGRQKIETFYTQKSNQDKVYKFAIAEIQSGRQVYIVCPLVDENDALKIESVLFHPLFFIEKYLSKSSSNYDSCKIDLSFIGTIHSDRYKLIKEIFSRYLDLKLKTYYYLYLSTPLLYAYHKLFNPAFESSKYREFRFKALSQEEIIEIFENSKVILDIQHPLQTGLTMRTFETMALGRKLITTNATINRNNVEIPASFLEMPFKKIHDEILNKYSLRNWLKIIFDD